MLNTEVTKLEFDESADTWHITTKERKDWRAQFVIMATGNLSIPRKPDINGIEDFQGRHYFTSQWPDEKVEFGGMNVGLIGTGSTGIQLSQVIAREAKHLTIFQRTPNFSVPAGPLTLEPEYIAALKKNYREFRQAMRNTRPAQRGRVFPINERTSGATPAERERAYEERWQAGSFAILETFSDIFTDMEANEHLAEFARAKIRAIVKDPAVAELVTPKGYPFGSKRLCVDLDYYSIFNRDNVTLVDVRGNPIDRIVAEGVRLADGTTYPLDIIVFAIGFDAETGALLAIDIRGRGGVSLRDKWKDGPATHLGLMSAGFPNLFMVTGPGSPSVTTNLVIAIEQHVEWIFDLIDHMRDRELGSVEPEEAAERDWVAQVKELADQTIYSKNPNTWYMGANVEGKPRVIKIYLGGFDRYQRICAEVAKDGYKGFRLRPAHQPSGQPLAARQPESVR